MNKPIRSIHKHIRMAKLDAGYREQRAWFSVGMTKITVELYVEPWASELPIVVSHKVVDGNIESIAIERFKRSDIDEARKLFARAGRVGQWPAPEAVDQLTGERKNNA